MTNQPDQLTSPPTHGGPRTSWCLALLTVLCLGLYLPNAWSLPLAEPEESRCAMIVQHMVKSGDWVLPHLDGEIYWDKPAPFFWLAAAGQILTGNVELGGRLVAALAGLAAVLMAFDFGRRLAGNRAGLLAGVILATSLEFLFFARWYRMDMPFAASLWAALWWFWRYEGKASTPVREARRWAGCGAFCGLAVLLKGPAGLMLPMAIVGLYFLLSGQARRIWSMFNYWGCIAFLAVSGPWYIAVISQEPRYFQEFFLQQNLARYFERSYNRHTLYSVGYLGVIFVGMLPWSVYLPGAIGRTFPRWRSRKEQPATLLLWVFALLILVFFCLARTQLINYVLPLFAPLAVLIALPVARWAGSAEADRTYHLGGISLAIMLVLILGGLAGAEWYWHLLDWRIVLVAAVVAGGVALMLLALRDQRRRAFLGWAAATWVGVLLFMSLHTLPGFYPSMSSRELGLTLREADPAAILCCWGADRHSVPVYAGQTQMLRFDPKSPADLDLLDRFLTLRPHSYCLISNEDTRPGASAQVLRKRFGDRLVSFAKEGQFELVYVRPPAKTN